MNASYIFSLCKSLSFIPDISKWDTKKTTDMSYMFYKCNSLTSLPDISKWEISKVTNINYIFSDCYSLASLPDISNWKFNKDTYKVGIFNNCFSMISLPDNYSITADNNDQNSLILLKKSKYINNDTDFKNKNIIEGELYINFEEINNNIVLFKTEVNNEIDVYLNNKKINIIKEDNKYLYGFQKDGYYKFKIVFNSDLNNYEGFFENCSQIILLDLSNFDTSNVINFGKMLKNCKGIQKIIGIDKLITNKIVNMSEMFNGCQKIEYLDLSNFNTNNVTDMEGMFSM